MADAQQQSITAQFVGEKESPTPYTVYYEYSAPSKLHFLESQEAIDIYATNSHKDYFILV